MLNYQQAKYLVGRGDVSEALEHLEVSLRDPTTVVGNFDFGETLLLILATDRFDPLRRDPRFSVLVQRAYGDLAGTLEPMAGDAEVEQTLQDSLGEHGEDLLLNYQKAKVCLEKGDLDGAFQHLEASLSDKASSGNFGKTLLFLLTSQVFDPLRDDPRFDHLLMQASHWP